MQPRLLAIVSIVTFAALAGTAPAQVQDGHVLLCVQRLDSAGSENVIHAVDPKSGALATLYRSRALPTIGRMAMDEQNLGFTAVVTDGRATTLQRMSLNGALTTITKLPAKVVGNIRLDHDGRWVIQSANRLLTAGPAGVTHILNGAPGGNWTDVLIDRAVGVRHYIVALADHVPVLNLFGVDRDGTFTTITKSSPVPIFALDLDRATGEYVAATATTGSEIMTFHKSGGRANRTFSVPGGARLLHVNDDGTAWLGADWPGSPPNLTRIDLTTGATTRVLTYPMAGVNQVIFFDIDVYGRRRLTCTGSGKPGTTVRVRLSSRKPADAHRVYVLACSLGRNPVLRFGPRQRLCLFPDSLFRASVGANHALFAGFLGTTDGLGNAAAAVNLPAQLPSKLGLTVFVAGVILGPKGRVQTVTNTHWFVLS